MTARRRVRLVLAGIAIALAAACATQRLTLWTAPAAVRVEGASFSGWGPKADDWDPLRVAVRAVDLAPEDTTLKTVGKLTYRGGLELQSDDARFGGLSGVHVEPDGRLVAVSDQGAWFVARLTQNDAGDLTGLVDARVASMRDAQGRASGRKEDSDAEDIVRLADGRFAVSFERTHTIRIYDLDKNGPTVAPDTDLGLAGTEPLKANESLESLALLDDGLITAGEGVTSRSAPFWLVPLASDNLPTPSGRTSTNDFYGLVALARLPDGDYIAMERFFAPILGVRIHLRRVTRASIDAGRWEGETIADLAPPIGVDNFEGLALVPGDEGALRLYLISDDNFSDSQRTLLYAFDLKL
ncbi:MAG: esterase-like activity of phytase family protein [Alphaproteobacteria bacterium]|nr:esterase-like activity of phytase family protein [Alphaproteobacteria bacterium]